MIKSSDRYYQIVQQLLAHAEIAINGSEPYDVQVHHPNFFKKILQHGSLGLGESYMDGWWDCPQLDLFFTKVIAAQLERKLPKNLGDMVRLISFKIRNKQSKKHSKVVAEEHYDLGNDLFSLMLDPYMQYSCGYWRDSAIQTLAQAQEAKLDLICRKLQLKSGMEVLDIGCGWGGLAEYMALRYNVKVDGLTISAEQAKLAKARCKGLNVDIQLKDYRDIEGQYDRVVSVGMFEHVGPKNYHRFFSKIAQVLNKDGLFLLHTIGSNKSGFHNDSWMNKYVFANGIIPTVTDIVKEIADVWILEDWHNFGPDYDLTLMAWKDNFIKSWPQISENYSPRFYRMFLYYLNACAGLFRVRESQLWQIVLSKAGSNNHLRIAR